MESNRKNALLFLREDSRNPANHSPAPESEKERQTTATSGLRCYESYESYVPDGLLRKTFMGLLTSRAWWNEAVTLTWTVKHLTISKVTEIQESLFQSSPTLNRRDIPSKYVLFRLLPSARPTEGTEFGYLLSTPKASQIDSTRPNMKGGKTIQDDLNRMPMVPTPAARDWKGAGTRHGQTTPCIVEGRTGAKTGLKLQPAFVEWMMGYPKNFTNLKLPTEYSD